MNLWAATQRLTADVMLAEGQTIRGDLHLQARVARHDGPETPLEMLNRPDPFFPMTLPNGEVIFVSKAQVAVVASGVDVLPIDPARDSAAQHFGLDVMLKGGSEFRGFATGELPPNRSRPLDYLNSPEAFFEMAIKGRVLFINRGHVRVVRPAS